jgi:AraC family transcriptional regulator, transcriptional activator FtrA
MALALPGVVLLDLAAAAHLFGHCGAPHYTFEVASLKMGPVRSSTGLDIVAQRGLPGLGRADTIVVPGCSRPAATPSSALAALRRAHLRRARVMSICTGAFVLGEAGLLDGRRATTHWAAIEELIQRYPAAHVEPDVLYVDEGSILTSAGVAAGLDLCLHVIRRDHGAALAARLARRTVVAPHRDGGQAQFVDRPVEDGAGLAGSLEPTRQWALAQLQEPLDVASLARRACMSPRTFARRFRQETGTSPGQWVLEQRTRAAQALLETTDLPVEHVAQRCGFGSAATLRTQFGRRLSTTPTRYRRTFRPR